MFRMKASAVMWKLTMSPSLAPACGDDLSLEADVVGLGGGEGGEVVGADQGCGAGVEGVAVELVGPPEGSALLEGAGGGAGEYPVAIGAGLGVPAGVEAIRHRRCRGDGDVVGADAIEPPRQIARRLGFGFEACDLAEGMHSRIRSSSHGQLDRLAQHRRQSGLQLSLHRPQSGLLRPASEARAVVFDVQADRGHLPSKLSRPASSRIVVSYFSALASFEPGFSPATT